ncbi:alpha/beta hydrolase [Arenimonas sp.]|uniref:alpha/beta hydrolase n=1 Tax=Arenimonas sp. TaxID=1872635 RepID=UPI0035B1F802
MRIHLAWTAALAAAIVALTPTIAVARALEDWITHPARADTVFSGDNYLHWLARVGSPLEQFQPAQGPRLAFAVVEPADYQLAYEFIRLPEGMGFTFEFKHPAPALPPPVRGTVVLLHGWSMDAGSLLPWSLAFSQRGYRTVLLDLRNHGLSGEAPAGYGTHEAADVMALLGHLRAQKRIAEPVHLFGVSYGAVTALHAAAQPDASVAGVVAMEPFANAADSIRHYAGRLKSGAGGGWRGRALGWWLRATVDDDDLGQALDRAGQRLGVDLRTLDTARPVAATRACVLLLHGARDQLVPVAAARSLAMASQRLRYAELPEEDHFTLPARLDWLSRPIGDWLGDAGTADGRDCPAPALPADPLP